jgi:hypothetical protein
VTDPQNLDFRIEGAIFDHHGPTTSSSRNIWSRLNLSWPPGTLRINRAGFDEVESSARIFNQAATALAAVISAKLHGRDAEAALQGVVSSW